MSYVTVEVDIDHGKIVAREPGRLPEKGTGILTVISPEEGKDTATKRGYRVKLPLVHCKPGTKINPTPEELDASLWD